MSDRLTPLGLVIALGTYQEDADLPELPAATIEEACKFVDWLIGVRGVHPADIRFCGSPLPAPGRVPPEVVLKGAATQQITKVLRELAETTGLDSVREVFVYVSGHGFSVNGDTLLPAQDFLAGTTTCFNLTNLQRYLTLTIGPSNLYWFINTCRTVTTNQPAEILTPKAYATKGSGVSSFLASAVEGAGARTSSEFTTALLAGLRGRGSAKLWVDDSYWVTFDAVVGSVRAVMKGVELDADRREKDRLIMPLADVPDVGVTVAVRQFQAGQKYRLRYNGTLRRGPAKIYIERAEQQVLIPPDRWIFELVDVETDTELALVLPKLDPRSRGDLPIFEDRAAAELRLEFEPPPPSGAAHDEGSAPTESARHPERIDLTSAVAEAGASAAAIQLRIRQGAQVAWHRAASRTTRWMARPINVQSFDRDERFDDVWVRPGRVTLGLPPNLVVHPAPVRSPRPARRGQRRPKPAAPVVDAPVSPDRDPSLVLSLLAGRAIGQNGRAAGIGDLLGFSHLRPQESALYVVAPTGALVELHGGGSARLQATVGTEVAAGHVALDAESGPHRLRLRIPGADLLVETTAVAGRVTVVVVQPDTAPDGRPDDWAVRQLSLRPRPGARADLDLDRVRFSALMQRRMSQNRPVVAERPDQGNADLWGILVAGRWDDPLTTLLAVYELTRRGALAGPDRPRLERLLERLEAEATAVPHDLTVLRSLLTGERAQSLGAPLVLDGAMRVLVSAEVEQADLAYGSVWTTWRPQLDNPAPSGWRRGLRRSSDNMGWAPGGSETGYLYRRGQLVVKAGDQPAAEQMLRTLRLAPVWSKVPGFERAGLRLGVLPASAPIPALVAWLHAQPRVPVPSAQPMHLFVSRRQSDSGCIDELDLAQALTGDQDCDPRDFAGYSHGDRAPALLAYAARRIGLGAPLADSRGTARMVDRPIWPTELLGAS